MDVLTKRLRTTSAVIMERIDEALGAVLDNIADPNTAPTAVREINVKLKIKPNNDRSTGVVEISCAKKIAPVAPWPMTLFFGRDSSGKNVVAENNVEQTDMFLNMDPETGEVRDNIQVLPGRKVM